MLWMRFFNEILIGKQMWIFCILMANLAHDLCFVYEMETFLTFN